MVNYVQSGQYFKERESLSIDEFMKTYKKLEKFLQNQLKLQHAQINLNFTEKSANIISQKAVQNLQGFRLSEYFEAVRDSIIKMYQDSVKIVK